MPDNVKERTSNDQLSPQSILAYGTLFGTAVLKFQNPLVALSAIGVQAYVNKDAVTKSMTTSTKECVAGIIAGAALGGAIGLWPGVLSGALTGAALCMLSNAKDLGNTQLELSKEPEKDKIIKSSPEPLVSDTRPGQNFEGLWYGLSTAVQYVKENPITTGLATLGVLAFPIAAVKYGVTYVVNTFLAYEATLFYMADTSPISPLIIPSMISINAVFSVLPTAVTASLIGVGAIIRTYYMYATGREDTDSQDATVLLEGLKKQE